MPRSFFIAFASVVGYIGYPLVGFSLGSPSSEATTCVKPNSPREHGLARWIGSLENPSPLAAGLTTVSPEGFPPAMPLVGDCSSSPATHCIRNFLGIIPGAENDTCTIPDKGPQD